MKANFAQAVIFGVMSLSGVYASDMLSLSNDLEWAGKYEISVVSPYLNSWQAPIKGVIIDPVVHKTSLETKVADEKPNSSAEVDLSNLLTETPKQEAKSNDDLSALLAETPKQEAKAIDDLSALLAETPKQETKSDGLSVESSPASTEQQPAVSESATNTVAASEDASASSLVLNSDNTLPSTLVEAAKKPLEPQLLFEDEGVSMEWPANLDPRGILITTTKPFTLHQILNLLGKNNQLKITVSPTIEKHLNDVFQLQFIKTSLPQVLKWISEIYNEPSNLKDRQLIL